LYKKERRDTERSRYSGYDQWKMAGPEFHRKYCGCFSRVYGYEFQFLKWNSKGIKGSVIATAPAGDGSAQLFTSFIRK
jgi:hypothetical protein